MLRFQSPPITPALALVVTILLSPAPTKAFTILENAPASAPVLHLASDEAGEAKKEATRDYLTAINKRVERNRYYPEEARKQKLNDVGTVRVTVVRSGEIKPVEITKSTGHYLLDQAMLISIVHVGKVPEIPDMLGRDVIRVTIPIRCTERQRLD